MPSNRSIDWYYRLAEGWLRNSSQAILYYLNALLRDAKTSLAYK